MRRLILLALLAAPLASYATDRATVDQLRQALLSRQAAHDSDENLARYIGSVELTERLTPLTQSQIRASLSAGPKTAQALDLLTDESALLDPPAAELPTRAAPETAEQQAMLNAAVHFVAVTFRSLPNFLASRVTRSFDDSPLVVTHSGWAPSHTDLHLVGTFNQEITYRDGREATLRAVTTSGSDTKQGASPPGLTSSGEFGPILAVVLRDASKGTITWSHWEQTANGVAGVFHFQVPVGASHYEVNFCCVLSAEDPNAYRTDPGAPNSANFYRGMPAYHGSLAIDTATGSILRLTLDPELSADGPISRSAIAVDYGPVEIGGESYACPIRSVALSRARARLGGDMSDRIINRLNEVSFTSYHRFGSTMRIITDASAH